MVDIRRSPNRMYKNNTQKDADNIKFSELKNMLNNTFMLLGIIKAAPVLWWIFDETEE